MLKLAIVATTSLAAFGGGQPVFAQAAISEPGAYAFYHPDADMLNAGRFTVSDSANASASKRDSRIDRQARVPQTLSRHHRRSSAADARSTAYAVITGGPRLSRHIQRVIITVTRY